MTDASATRALPDLDGRKRQFVAIAGYVSGLPRGQRAELRRGAARGSAIPPEVFWRIVDRYAIPEHEEQYWQTIAALMVVLPHQSGIAPGRAVASSGVAGARAERWLRHDRDRALGEAARLFARVTDGVNWADLGLLLLLWTPRQRRKFARDFYLDYVRMEQEEQPEEEAPE